MGKVIVVTSGKGGVGKTTTAANLGAGLAMQGRRVALMDMDIGLRNLDVMLGLESRIIYDLLDVAAGACRLRQALVADRRCEGLFLLPAAQTRDKTALAPARAEEIARELAAEFDDVLIDCPAGIEQGFQSAVAGAGSAIVVTVPEVAAVRDADRVIGLLSARGIEEVGLIVNRARADLMRRGDMLSLEDTLAILGAPLLGVVPEDERVLRAGNLGEPAVRDEDSRAGAAYRAVARRLLGQEEAQSQKGRGGLLRRARRLFARG